MSKHSTGPWEAGIDGFVTCADGDLVCDFGWGTGLDGENGRLIAAAPDLLSALLWLVQEGPSPLAWERARAAIAKAK